MSKKKDKKKKNKNKIIWLLVIFVILLPIVVIIINGWLLLGLQWKNSFSNKLAEIIPYPAVLVNYQIVNVADYFENIEIANYFQNHQLQDKNAEILDEKEIKKNSLNKLVENKILVQLADEYEITVDENEITAELAYIYQSLGGRDEFINHLHLVYGMTLDEFIEKSLKPEILFNKLYNKYNLNDSIDYDRKEVNRNIKMRIEKILERIKSGESFEEIAKNESEDDLSKGSGGELGYFSRGEMVPEFEEAAFSLNIGEVSNAVRTAYGYHIIKLNDKRVNDDGIEQVSASHILLKTEDLFSEWLIEAKKDAKVYIFVKGYDWENGEVIINR